MLYLALITLANKKLDNIYSYQYINQGLMQFYLSIINNILDKITSVTLEKNRIIRYFETTHYITLMKMKTFLQFVISNIDTLEIIDIRACTNSILKNFMILNYFKDILESYNEVCQNKVTVYARINDWGTLTGKMFDVDITNARMLIVHKNVCKASCITEYCNRMSSDNEKIKFTQVFDSTKFTDNMTITKYMTLETQLSKKKGIMMMTYGYSGTGKTFTLFGSEITNASGEKVKKEGILQATLNNIKGLSQVRFRVLELYGLGVQYPHYWKQQIYERVITYNLKVNDSDNIDIVEYKSVDKIADTFNNTINNFINIDENKIENTFKNFGNFIDKLDEIRRKEKRIRITANNPESSRSIVIYEFQLLIDNSYVPFVIIDLPGREEIVETYTDNYLERRFVPDKYKTEFHRAILSSMSVNPLALSILVPDIIFETFNTLEPQKKREEIVDTPLDYNLEQDFHITDESDESDDEDAYIITHGNKAIFQDEVLSKSTNGLHTNKLSKIYNFSNYEWTSQRKFILDHEHKVKITATIKNTNQIPTITNSIQYRGALALHLINRIILLKKFDVLENIYENIIKRYFNISLPNISKQEKINFLKEWFDESKIKNLSDDNLDELRDEKINFRTYMAPFEGIYINENIVGLIKVLSYDILEKPKDFIKKELTPEQDNTLSFKIQKQNIRASNYELYKDTQISTDYEKYDNIYRSKNVLNNIINNNKKSYSSQKIFNYKKPSIEHIIKIYTTSRNIIENGVTVQIDPVSDFKLFYLLSNTSMEKKCGHQNKLLGNTLAFINAISIDK